MQPTPAQIEAYQRDGFLVVEEFIDGDELERVREHFARGFEHDWETGLPPDEVDYPPGMTPPDKTRQICNLWKADRTIAATTLAARNTEFDRQARRRAGRAPVHRRRDWKPTVGQGAPGAPGRGVPGLLRADEPAPRAGRARRHV